jgi:tRNA pseudouridine55 synthase
MHDPLTGLIAVDKPAGVSSRHVVDVVGRALRTRSVGHAGTLDPLARGVVIACVGNATRLVDFLHELPKHYSAVFLLGRSSPSDDLETPVEEEADPIRPAAADVAAAAAGFRGEIMQRPCDYSAVHVDGKRAYRLARRGRELDLPAKRVRIDRLEITAYEWPRLEVEIECSSGTFVRALGRDLAAALGTRAVMESLVRSAVGPFTLAASLPLAAVDPDTAPRALLPAAVAVGHLPRVVLEGDRLAAAVRGGLLPLESAEIRPPAEPVAAAVATGDSLAAVDAAGDLVGILRRHDRGGWRLRPNFRGAG